MADDTYIDKNIFKYCNENPNDLDCACLHPSDTVTKIGEELLLPYYCWYEPCKRKTAKIPSALRENIKRCNVINCTVSLGDVSLLNGILKVSNSCLAVSALSAGFELNSLNQHINVPILNPFYFVLCLVLLSLLLFA